MAGMLVIKLAVIKIWKEKGVLNKVNNITRLSPQTRRPAIMALISEI